MNPRIFLFKAGSVAVNLRLTFVSLLCGSVLLCGSEPEKTIYAHYMGCYPAGNGAIAYHLRHQADNFTYETTDSLMANGGSIVNWALTPQGVELTPEQSAELEIQRAMRGGIDGFVVDAWAGGDGAKAVLDQLFAAAERMQVPFELSICLDPACHPKGPEGNHIQAYTDSINWLIDNHGDSPNLARRDGKVFIMGYGSRSIIYDADFRALPETPEKWQQISDAYKQVETNVGQPLFFHFDFDNLAMQLSRNEPEKLPAAAAWAGENFDAVGGFIGVYDYWYENPELIEAIKAGGAEWNQPLFAQYNNKGGSLFVEPGTDKLRQMWKLARERDATLMQFVTWNDYGEDTILAPGYSTNYTILSLNRYLIDWWKLGHEPAVEEDQIHLIFRRSLNDAPTFPFYTSRSADGVLEVATILKAPGTVTLPQRDISYDAPAGLHIEQFPLEVGQVSAALSRDGKEILSVTAPEEVTERPFRSDNSMVCFSSNFMEEWQADFGDTPALLYSENGDIDADGLPNWFEMLYFGKFPMLETATSAEATVDPDHDGLTNIQEYTQRSDPTKPEVAYAKGDVWDFSDVYEKGISFNPDRDSHGQDVWYFLYKHGPEGSIALDGEYSRMNSSGANIPYAGLMAHLSPAKDPDGHEYPYLHGWIAHRKTDEGQWQMILRPRQNAAVVLGWRSPVNGVVDVSFDVAEVQGRDAMNLEILRNNEPEALLDIGIQASELPNIELSDVAVKKGETLYLVADGASVAWLENFKIKLTSIDE